MQKLTRLASLFGTCALLMVSQASAQDATNTRLLKELATSKVLKVSTILPNGDVNPYGVAFVPEGFPEDSPLKAEDILVSNFNNGKNFQGTGTTIVSIAPKGSFSCFSRVKD